MLIRDGAHVHVLPVDRIDYVEAQDDYVCFMADGKQYLKDQTLAAAEQSLDPARFVRIHRSYLLNIERIARSSCTRRTAGWRSCVTGAACR